MSIPAILCIGAVQWDLIGHTADPMPAGADLPGRVSRMPGGVAFNIAQALAREGLTVALLATVGTDAEGEGLVRAGMALGLDMRFLHRGGATDLYLALEAEGALVGAVADARALEEAGEAVLEPLRDGRLATEALPFAGTLVIDGNLPEPVLRGLAASGLLARADLRLAPASPAKLRGWPRFWRIRARCCNSTAPRPPRSAARTFPPRSPPPRRCSRGAWRASSSPTAPCPPPTAAPGAAFCRPVRPPFPVAGRPARAMPSSPPISRPNIAAPGGRPPWPPRSPPRQPCVRRRHLMNAPLALDREIAEALLTGQPVVALESTIITHGMPYPQNVDTAREVEATVRAAGGVPATIAVMDGQIRVGLGEAELERLARAEEVQKLSRADLATCLATGAMGSTTVAATMIAANLAGISVFATGGIGGVHRGAETSFDISADLNELAQTPVTVVSAGAKAILDLPRPSKCSRRWACR